VHLESEALTFRSGADADVAVTVTATSEVAAALQRSCQPWLDVTGETPTGVTVVGGLRLAEPARRRRVVATLSDEPDRVLYISDERRELVVEATDERWMHQQILRCVRNLLRWQQVGKSGAVFLHAGMITYGGIGVGFLGGKKSGKTSSVLAALAAGAGFLSNDDVSLHREGERWIAYGWPRTLVIRPETRAALRDRLPGLSAPRTRFGHPTNAAGSDGIGADLWVTPDELASAVPCELVRSARVGALVLPVFDNAADEPSCRRLELDEAAVRLAPHHERIPVKYDAFLSEWFSDRLDDREPTASVCAHLAGSLPVFELRQRMETLAPASALIAQIIREAY
jgi:hypothetical protein